MVSAAPEGAPCALLGVDLHSDCSSCDHHPVVPQLLQRKQGCRSPTAPNTASPPPGTCILFGDGCGAVLVSAAPEGAPCALLGVDMHSDGSGQKSLNALYSGSGSKPLQVWGEACSSGLRGGEGCLQ